MKKIILMLMLCAPMTMFAQKFGKVNTTTIFNSLPEVARVKGELDALRKQKENEMKGMQDELTRKGEEYEKSKSTMNATKQKETEAELQTLYQKIQQAFQDAQKELSEKEAELTNPVLAKIRNAIDAVGKAGGYTYIFEEGAAVYTGETVKDVTAEVQAKIGK